MLFYEDNRVCYSFDSELVWIQPWGPDALRVRATKSRCMPCENWALTEPVQNTQIAVDIKDNEASITNGRINAVISASGKIVMKDTITGKVVLEEFVRNRRDLTDPNCSALEIGAREFKPVLGTSNYNLGVRFESLNDAERLYGMGQYQHGKLNLKGVDLELAHRNSQASVPFVISSEGYGFLWNNPSVGRAVFAQNATSFEAYSTQGLDYWIVAGATPADILEAYASVTGTVPMMPEYGLGFWQCKLRYQTQDELLDVAREYKRRELPLDVIVVDFFHWPTQGDWKFDSTYWPNPSAMVQELRNLGVELMVSVWPTVNVRSENFPEMMEKGWLVRTDRGLRNTFNFFGETVFFDATNPQARDFVWRTCKRNYYDLGIRAFWLDEAEPEFGVYDFDNYRYHAGSHLQIGNVYPLEYARTFYNGQIEAGQQGVVNLLRCAWAGSQKFGTLVWSGDIASSWVSFRHQLAAGLSMGLAGIPWWTSDIGGFHGGNPDDPSFRELFVRWFQWAAFCPVMRLHGDREPRQPQYGTTGGAVCRSGAANEVWSYGSDVYDTCVKYMRLREEMRDYTREQMVAAHERGTPVMRPLFYDFPHDPASWLIETQYMYGPSYLCCPVLYPGLTALSVYFPGQCRWQRLDDGTIFNGGQTLSVECPPDTMPVFIRLK